MRIGMGAGYYVYFTVRQNKVLFLLVGEGLIPKEVKSEMNRRGLCALAMQIHLNAPMI